MIPIWPKVPLKTIYKGLYDGPHATPAESDKGAIFLGIKNVTESGRLDLSEIRYIAEADLDKWTKRVIPQKDDIVFSYEATLHRYARIPEGFRGCLGRRMALIRVNQEVANIDFVLCYFLGPVWRREVEKNILTGATVDRIPLTNVPAFNIYLPPLVTQQKIAAILSAYDGLIENNLKRIKLLEEMAQITYEEWFVRLKFPGHETASIDSETGLPEGWKETNICALIEHEIGGGWGEEEKSNEFSEPAFVIRGTDFDNLPTGDIKNVPYRFHKKSNLSSRKLQDGDIVFEVSGGSQNEGVAKSVIITDELLAKFNADVMCASFCKLARPANKEKSYLLFHFLRFLRTTKGTEVFEIRSASNIVNYNWTAFLKFQQIRVPNQELIKKFNCLAEPIHRQIYQLGKQNQLLKEARDILLPRLMTGMIDVEQLVLPEPINKQSSYPMQEPQAA